ncbi:MAG: TolC family protein [Bacteroidales bacterium]|nr:TolC family protein [Bacteroidales bacterium]
MRKTIITYVILCVVGTISAKAQNDYSSILKDVETNNIELQALRAELQAQQIENNAANKLENLSVEGSYSWGNHVQMGPKKTLSVAQPFDFPTVYAVRGKLMKITNSNLELHYSAERMNILLEAKKLCVEITYYNSLIQLYNQRLDAAKTIADNYNKKMEAGKANILEVNKAELNLTSLQSEYDKAVAERQNLLVALAGMNGGKAVAINNVGYEKVSLPANFETWYKEVENKNPILLHAQGLVDVNKQQLKLTKNQWLPQLHVGYVNETVVDESYQGVAVGLSLPLWNNKSKVKQSKAQLQTSEAILDGTRNECYNTYKTLYNQSQTLQQNADKLASTLSRCNSEALLQKALDAGEISLLEYLLEIEFYQQAAINTLAAQRDAQMALAELFAIDL